MKRKHLQRTLDKQQLDIGCGRENKCPEATDSNIGIRMATKHGLEALLNDPLIQMYANAPEDIYQLAKNTNPMLRKAIEWAKAIVTSHEV
jgi:thymidine phosphorylase